MINLNKYKSEEEAVNDHKQNYRSFGGAGGKFKENSPGKHRIEKIVNAVPEGSIVLDIGCNDGSLGLRLQDKGCVVYAVDVVKELVAVAQSRGLIANVGRADKLEYKDRKFDVVVMAEVMEHLFNPDDALREIARVLDKDGLFVGSVPHDKGHLGEGKKADYHNWIFSKADLEAMFGKYFKEVEITETEYSKDFCDESNVPLDLKQWNNWICEGVR